MPADAAEPTPSTPTPTGDLPWAKGVSKDKQTVAFELFDQGNKKFVERDYAEALATYRQALAQWDHPAIRFNIAECLIHLDRPVEAYEHLQKSMLYGAAALGEQVHQRAVINDKLLKGQLARITISVEEAGADVTLDGEPLFKAPGSATRVVKPGRHQIVAKKAGHITQTREVVALPGEPSNLQIKLPTLEAGAKLERRWSAWVPWTVLGAGAVVAGLGGVFQLQSSSNANEYEDEIARQCPNGCLPSEIPESTKDLEDRSELQNVLGVSMLATGGAILVGGIVLVILNQPRRVEVQPDGRLAVQPMVGRDTVGASLSFDF
ncbi:MAG: tetratricopeptide repeat protein [Deltaproteobacteria bacterium]|nr:tetratricopeptide repeat protein [Deltaproteobacteria bacterium]